ncbi:DUF58 domain-containing protein [Thermaerobacter subterraneus]|uniref:DUF58 domain-containing protein n=1 Tax=Thermaerobacter subterraneus DSM 13965 TaxID=867903 RepID=K6Q0T1_9FIRM|nr:DUF58 domain-containing protein [Thermaerobacter subterraneus]EKP94494.1 hypothetical protein ThesuDRAFT_02232 [Thermaerobacter subterraneus DSM 13965]
MRLQSWGLPLWTLAALVFALTTGGPVPWFLFKFLLALHLLGAGWAWLLARGLDVQARVDRGRAVAGERVELEVFVHNESVLPAPRLVIALPAWDEPLRPGGWRPGPEDGDPPSAAGAGGRGRPSPWPEPGRVFYRSLGPLGNLLHREAVILPRRGRYRLGPVVVEVQEPLGLFRLRRAVFAEPALVVYPRPVPVDGLPILPRQPFGRQRVDTRAWQDPSSLADVRPFRPGDNPKHIHWKVSARLDELHVKEFDLRATTDCYLFLDLHAGAGPEGDPWTGGRRVSPDERAGPAGPPSPAGLGGPPAAGMATAGKALRGGPGRAPVTGPGAAAAEPPRTGPAPEPLPLDISEGVAGVAAGIAALALHRELVVAAAAHTGRPHRLAPGRGPQQYRRLLEWLVDVNQPGTMPLADFLAARRSWLTPRSAVLVVTPQMDRRLGRVLAQLRSQGHAVAVWYLHQDGGTAAAVTASASAAATREGMPATGGGGAGSPAAGTIRAASGSGGEGSAPSRPDASGAAGVSAGANTGASASAAGAIPGVDPALVRWLLSEGVEIHPVPWPEHPGADAGAEGRSLAAPAGPPGAAGVSGLRRPLAPPPAGAGRRAPQHPGPGGPGPSEAAVPWPGTPPGRVRLGGTGLRRSAQDAAAPVARTRGWWS